MFSVFSDFSFSFLKHNLLPNTYMIKITVRSNNITPVWFEIDENIRKVTNCSSKRFELIVYNYLQLDF